MRICGADIAGKSVNLVVLEQADDGSVTHIALTPKISLDDGKSQAAVRSFAESLAAFARLNGIDKIAIRSRAGKGQFAGGAESFKIEGVIQMLQDVEVTLVSPVAIASHEKKYPAPTLKIFAYQGDAYRTARCFIGAK